MTVVLLISALLVILSVAVHLMVLEGLLRFAWSSKLPRRIRLGAMILGAIGGHLVEIGLFAVGLRLLLINGGYGQIEGSGTGYLDDLYFSAVSYTTVGYGDLIPNGPLRIFAAIEALAGLVLIAWTASFAFMAMQRLWPRHD